MLPQREDCEHAPVCKFDDQLCPGECGHFADKNETIDAASELNGMLCADCGEVMDRPFINGDNVERCEACAVEKYKKGQVSMLWPKDKPYRPI